MKNSMNKTTKIALTVGFVVLASLVYLVKQRFQSLDQIEVSQSSESIPAVLPVASKKSGEPVAAVPVSAPVLKSEPTITQEQREMLSKYRSLKTKVFMSDQEAALHKRLLADRGFVRNLASVLRVSAVDLEAQRTQDSAIDLLLDAATNGFSEVAAEAFREVISDDQIENSSIPKEGRQALAEIKAEVLYQWTAIDPSRVSEVEDLLPGPVSKRIWANVLDTQTRNVAESSALVERELAD
ncbi:MAG: hypothetical protein V4692_04750 [Bdellovibrionota bacterium]